MNCENCNQEHEGQYGSGRFCSSGCARGFSTKARRGEINARLSEKLKGSESPLKGKPGRKHSPETLQKLRDRCGRKKHDWEKMIQDWEDQELSHPEWMDPKKWIQKVRKHLMNKSGNRCSQCGWDKVHPQTGRVPLEVDHIDGDHLNNRPSNLRILCPNCHALTPTYRTLNPRGKGYRALKKQTSRE